MSRLMPLRNHAPDTISPKETLKRLLEIFRRYRGVLIQPSLFSKHPGDHRARPFRETTMWKRSEPDLYPRFSTTLNRRVNRENSAPSIPDFSNESSSRNANISWLDSVPKKVLKIYHLNTKHVLQSSACEIYSIFPDSQTTQIQTAALQRFSMTCVPLYILCINESSSFLHSAPLDSHLTKHRALCPNGVCTTDSRPHSVTLHLVGIRQSTNYLQVFTPQ